MIHMIIILIASLLMKVGHEIFDHIRTRNAVREAVRRSLEEIKRTREEAQKTHEEKKDQ